MIALVNTENGGKLVSAVEQSWNDVRKKNFYLLKQNEEKLNDLFINAYNLQDELGSEVDDKDVMVDCGNTTNDVRCIFHNRLYQKRILNQNIDPKEINPHKVC